MDKVTNEQIVKNLEIFTVFISVLSIVAAVFCFIEEEIPKVYGFYLVGASIILYVSVKLFLVTIETLFEIRDLLKKDK